MAAGKFKNGGFNMQITTSTFGQLSTGEEVLLYRLTNETGAYVEVLSYGCRIRSICVPNRQGRLTDVCFGYKDMAGYETDSTSLGAAVGRYANRIENGSFTLGGKTFSLERNNGSNHLHGGSQGFAYRLWDGECHDGKVTFSRHFPDGDGGFPGNLDMKISYGWTEDNRLSITYEGLCDQDTVLSVTNHAYFNLEGCESASAWNHELQIFASATTKVDGENIPTGQYLPVEGTPFDFRQPKAIGRDIEKPHSQFLFGLCYDHNFVLDGEGFRRAAVLTAPKSGIRMTCHTDQPGLQIYTGGLPKGRFGKYNEAFCPGNSVCLETQHFPNSPNVPNFPSVTLKAGEAFATTTCYAFDTV